MLKHFALAALLIAVPAAGFSAFEVYTSKPAQAAVSKLGDLSEYKTIVADVQAIVAKGDLAGAKTRIRDFEKTWDDAEDGMRPKDEAAWAVVDDAADGALHALRAKSPQVDEVNTTLAALAAAVENPSGSDAAPGGVQMVAGIAVTDQVGHPIACEDMVGSLSKLTSGGKVSADKMAGAMDFLGKAMERCNADDDARADEFAAQGLALAN